MQALALAKDGSEKNGFNQSVVDAAGFLPFFLAHLTKDPTQPPKV